MSAERKFHELSETIIAEMKRLKVPGAALAIYHAGQEFAAGFGKTSIEHPCASRPIPFFRLARSVKLLPARC